MRPWFFYIFSCKHDLYFIFAWHIDVTLSIFMQMWSTWKLFYFLCPRVCSICASDFACSAYLQSVSRKEGWERICCWDCGGSDSVWMYRSRIPPCTPAVSERRLRFIIQQEISVSSGAENTLFRRRDNICTCVKRTLCWERSESKGLFLLPLHQPFGGWWSGKNRQLSCVFFLFVFCPPQV